MQASNACRSRRSADRCANVNRLLQRDGACQWCLRISIIDILRNAMSSFLNEDGSRSGDRLRRLDASACGGGRESGATQVSRGRVGEATPTESVVSLLAAPALQQEDSLNRVRLDTSHAFHLEQTGQGAVLKSLYAAGCASADKNFRFQR